VSAFRIGLRSRPAASNLAKGVSVMAVICDPQCREVAINWSNPRTP
jgi:hypothetical protein